jgi:hypothetical protein
MSSPESTVSNLEELLGGGPIIYGGEEKYCLNCKCLHLHNTTELADHIKGCRVGHVRSECTSAAVKVTVVQNDGLYYGHEEGDEELEEYCMGGFHPVHLGDEFGEGRYKIVNKLGFGSYSTVWLARDSQRDRYVAVKMLPARFSEQTSEAEISRILGTARPDDRGKSYVHIIDDEFYIDGPNGRHLCLVSEPARCEVAALRDQLQEMEKCFRWRSPERLQRRPFWVYATYTHVV